LSPVRDACADRDDRAGARLRRPTISRDHAEFAARGVRFLDAPRHEPYGTVAVFVDPYGNKLDLIERRAPIELIALLARDAITLRSENGTIANRRATCWARTLPRSTEAAKTIVPARTTRCDHELHCALAPVQRGELCPPAQSIGSSLIASFASGDAR
jgi:hypothetical protein